MRLPFSFLLVLSALQFSLAGHGDDGHHGDPGPSKTGPHKASCTLVARGGDDSPHFLNAMQACSTVVIPASTTLNISTRLNMTGLRNKHIKLEGTLRFEPNIPYWSGNGFSFPFQTQITFWILGGKNIVLDGGGTLDGAGQAWYDAFASNSSLLRPITLTLFQATNVVVQNINMINSPEWFNLVNEGKNVTYDNIHINAVSNSAHGPSNTDGWDVYRSDQVTIKNSVINNGDDCVSFKVNSTNILVSNLSCNGSQSLGQFAGMFDIVENVTSTNIRMSNAQNGARIKAWAGQGVGSGIVKNVTFDTFIESNVGNPVVIDQCAQFPSNTFIQDVWFTNISGTSSGAVVASLACSPDGRCNDINVNNFNLSSPKGVAQFTCQNVNLTGNAVSFFPACTVT
ncbi:pectin lyase fold/virulence factor [Mycena sp. CBHHK59/15]|nr:pectin lyase fold/virulence factor [Mycena sp. CBHHK59/15]